MGSKDLKNGKMVLGLEEEGVKCLVTVGGTVEKVSLQKLTLSKNLKEMRK